MIAGIMPEPRLGFAYDLTTNHKTVLRGGFGMSHTIVSQGNQIFNRFSPTRISRSRLR